MRVRDPLLPRLHGYSSIGRISALGVDDVGSNPATPIFWI